MWGAHKTGSQCSRSRVNKGKELCITGSPGQQGWTPQSLQAVVRSLFFHSELRASGWLQAEEGHDLTWVLLLLG